MRTPSTANQPPLPYDRWLIVLALTLVSFGLLMVASASISTSDQQLHQPFYYFYRQCVFLIFGMALGTIIVQIEMKYWEKFSGAFLLGVMVLLALVIIPGVGRSVNGSMRWLGYGYASIEISELAKFAVIIYLAGYLIRREKEIKSSLSGFLKPMGLLAVIAVLLLKEPDFGATTVIILTAMGMMFLGGMQLRHFVFLLLVVLLGLLLIAISEPYRVKRLTTFLDPWSNPFNNGYQLTQSLIAFGRGGWFGVGLGKSVQKLFYLPEAHTDFLFAVIAEELGFIGCCVVILLFTFFVIRIFMIGLKAQKSGQLFSAYVAYGFALWIALQFLISVGVNSGVLPTKGLTLPLMSYGGSSMLITCLMFAVLLRIDFENRMQRYFLR